MQEKPVGKAGFRQQRLGLGGVVGVGPGQVEIGRVEGREVAPDQLDIETVDAERDGLAVERMGDRLADLRIVEGRLRVVGGEHDLALGLADSDLEPGVGSELGDRFRR